MSQLVVATREVWVNWSKEGIHFYPGADTDPKLATGEWDDVSFLGVPHRHIFHFNVSIEVEHNDRDIEFIQLKRWIDRLYSQGTLELDYKSCEMMAEDLAQEITKRYPGRNFKVTVSEDNENGATLTFKVNP